MFILEDLDIGMNEWLCEPFTWDDARRYDRGKVMSAAELEAGKSFGRYFDVDGDAIPWRTLPGTHPTKALISPAAPAATASPNIARRARSIRTICSGCCANSKPPKPWVPGPVVQRGKEKSRYGVIYFGSTAPAMREAMAALEAEGLHLDMMRLRAFPFPDAVTDFITANDQIFLVEQNRDAQMRSLLVNEMRHRSRAVSILIYYDGTPITARFIAAAIAERIARLTAKEAAE